MKRIALGFLTLLVATANCEPRREYGYLPVPGAKLAYVVYLPERGERFPVLMIYEPYWGGGRELRDEEADYVRAGYAVLAVSIRGTGCSEGQYTFMNPDTEARDGAAAVEWAARQRWSNGNVALYGNSYSGTVQFFIAALHPAGLKAMAAGGSVADRYAQSFYPGGIFNAAFSAQWTFNTQPTVSHVGIEARRKWGDTGCADASRTNRAYYDMAAHPLRDAWWRARSGGEVAPKVRTPVLLIEGWQDQQAASAGAPELFSKVVGPKKLILSNGRHEIFWQSAFRKSKLRWFDHWVRGIQNGVEREPPVSVWFESRSSGGALHPSWVENFQAWPPPGVQWKSLYLTAAGDLAAEKPPSGARTYFYPAGTEIPTMDGFQLRPASFGSLTYRTRPQTSDAVIIGAPRLVVYLSAEQPDTDVMAVLHDVDPEGAVTYLQRGFLRASHRNARAHDREQPLVPGKVYELTLEMFPVGHVLRRGHRLELLLAAPPTIPTPNWGFALKMLPGRNAVYHGPEGPSRLELPIVTGLAAKAPPPPCGALDMQPCRSAK